MHVNETRFERPNAKRENHRAISTSKPAFLPCTSMYPNGGESHLTAINHRFRSRTSAGSGGNVAAAARVAAGRAAVLVVAEGWASPNAAAKAATRVTPTTAQKTFFIQQLLLR